MHTGNFDDSTRFAELGDRTMTRFIRDHYRYTVIASGSYDHHTGAAGIKNNDFDLVALGRPFIANPNLIERITNDDELKDYDAAML